MPRAGYSKEQMTERSKCYFKDAQIKKMVATSDGHFYFLHDIEIARKDASKTKAKIYTISRSDITTKKATKK